MHSADQYTEARTDWTLQQVSALYNLSFPELIHLSSQVHRAHFNPNEVQVSSLLSIKTGACPEDCGYCSQSSTYNTGLTPSKKLSIDETLTAAKAAQASGATRFCMGAAWRNPPERDMPYLLDMVRQVKAMGLETCMTLGMLEASQAQRLKAAGLDYYNHNLDTSRSHYPNVISTRSYDDRLDTLAQVRAAGISVCTGGILGLGESSEDRIALLHELATLPIHPESVPINMLVPIAGTPLENAPKVSVLEWVKTIAVARLIMPRSYVRLSAGRESLTDAEQALCFLAGANSFFYGDTLLTTPNKTSNADDALLDTLGMQKAKPLACPA